MTSGRATAHRWRLPTVTALWLVTGTAAPAVGVGPGRPEPIPVVHSLTIRGGTGLALDEDSLRRTVSAPALARLRDAGWIRPIEAEGGDGSEAAAGRADFELAFGSDPLLATLAIELGGPFGHSGAFATRTTRASIALAGLDGPRVTAALEHLGQRATGRLVAELDGSLSPAADDARFGPIGSEAEGRDQLEAGRLAKRAGRLAEARRAFVGIAASGDAVSAPLRRLAQDELRYGLLLAETQQAFNDLGSVALAHPSPRRDAAIARAEHLLRQIWAENIDDRARTAEARRALEDLADARDRVGGSLQTSLRLRMQALRIAMVDFALSAGRCPEVEWIEDAARRMRTRVALDEITFEANHAMRYVFRSTASRRRVALRCSDDGIEIVETGDGIADFPAALSGSLPPALSGRTVPGEAAGAD